MTFSGSHALWRDPDSEISTAFHHLSFTLFRTDLAFGTVVSARVPEAGALAVGDHLPAKLGLSDEAIQYLNRTDTDQPPMFVLTSLGLGILSKKYDRCAGLGLYFHVHCHPESGARLLNNGAFGSPDGGMFLVEARVSAVTGPVTRSDERSYAALLDAWQTVNAGRDLLPATRDEVWVEDIRAAIEAMADFVGCEITFAADSEWGASENHGIGNLSASQSVRRVKCYRPLLLEAMLLYLLTEIRHLSLTRGATCTIGSSDGGEAMPLAMALRYRLDVRIPQTELLLVSNHRTHMGHVADFGGLCLQTSLLPAWESGVPDLSQEREEQEITLEWLFDPAVLPSSDLKAYLHLRYGEN